MSRLLTGKLLSADSFVVFHPYVIDHDVDDESKVLLEDMRVEFVLFGHVELFEAVVAVTGHVHQFLAGSK
jgi:predicted phosphohydrolase